MLSFCPKCGNPIHTCDTDDASRLCSVCAWFGDATETLASPPVTGSLDTAFRQCLALYREVCRQELLLEAAYLTGQMSLIELLRIRAKMSESEASLLSLFQANRVQVLRLIDGEVAWPADWAPRPPCDKLVGPCACGEWHGEHEPWVQDLLKQHNAIIEI